MTVKVPQYSRLSSRAGLLREIENDIKRKYDVVVILFLTAASDNDNNDDSNEANAPALEIVRLYVLAEERRQGLGSLVMNELCRHADANGWSMCLTASSRFGTTESVLTDFYARFGFELAGFSEDNEPRMIRPACMFTISCVRHRPSGR